MTTEDCRKAAPFRRAITTCAILVAGVLIAACSKAETDEAVTNFSSDPETAKIERIVHDYVINHPEIITEAFSRRDQRAMAKLVNDHRKEIETPFAGAWAGASDGDVVMVEFFDYACGFCRASNPDIARLLKEDRNLKVVWRELPVLGENSLTAAQMSLAAAKQGKFKDFHDKLYAAGPPTPATIAQAQKSAGIVPMQSPEFTAEIDKNNDLARQLGATGTPTFVIGDRIVSGAVGYQALKEAIAEARKKRA